MTILVWNVRGINKKERRQDIKDHIHKLKPTMIGLVETKVRPHKARRVLNCVPQSWSYANNYTHSNKCRIWIFWSRQVWNCNIINLSSQQITIEAKNIRGLDLVVSFIYGENWKN